MACAHKNAKCMYHASQSQETKANVQSAFRSSTSQLRYLSATIAFGMVCVYYCPCTCMGVNKTSTHLREWTHQTLTLWLQVVLLIQWYNYTRLLTFITYTCTCTYLLNINFFRCLEELGGMATQLEAI